MPLTFKPFSGGGGDSSTSKLESPLTHNNSTKHSNTQKHSQTPTSINQSQSNTSEVKSESLTCHSLGFMPEESLRESPAIQSSCHSEPLGEESLKESLVAYRDSSVATLPQNDKIIAFTSNSNSNSSPTMQAQNERGRVSSDSFEKSLVDKRDSSVATLPQNDKKSQTSPSSEASLHCDKIESHEVPHYDKKPFYSLFKKLIHKHNSTNKENAQDSKIYQHISMLAIINICFMICVFTPFAVYSSDVSQFDATQSLNTLCALFGIFLLSSSLLIYLSSFLYKAFIFKFSMLKLMSYGLSVILCIGVVYTFVLDYNVLTGEAYSQIDNFIFKNPHSIASEFSKYVDLLIGILSCVLIACLFYIKRYFLAGLKAMFVGLFVVWILSCVSIFRDTINSLPPPLSYKSKSYEELLPSFHNELTTLSSKSQNVIVLLFDGFSGSHLRVILEQFPEFKESLEGFVYYPNTLSLDGHTSRTAHTILTGHKLSAFNNQHLSLQEYALASAKALKESYRDFQNAGFHIASFGMPYLSAADSAPNISIYDDRESYTPAYEAFSGVEDIISAKRAHNRPIGEMLSIGLFYFSPYVFRLRIYKDFEFGNYSWLFGSSVQIGSFINGVKNAAQLPMIVRDFKVSPTQGKSFKYIHTMHSHYPFMLDAHTCLPKLDYSSTIPKGYQAFLPNARHYDNELCAIKESIYMLELLKREGIYDNTMIVLVSDHSYNDIIEHNMPYKPSIGNNPNPLLMIKNFHAKGALKTDWRFMSNADVYGILCDELKACQEPNILKTYPQGVRKLIHTLNVHWTQSAQRANHLIFEKIWEVEGDVLNPLKFKIYTPD